MTSNNKDIPRIGGIIFDVGDILYDASIWRRWLTDELQAAGVQISYPELVVHWETLLVDVYCGRARYWDRFDELLRTCGLPDGAIATLTEAARKKATAVQQDRRPMPEVPETLESLWQMGTRLAALSDTESGEARVRGILRQLGIEEYFAAVVTSADLGVTKPDPDAYRAAVDALGIPSDRCAFVGHDVDELEGAQHAGLLAIAYNYHPEVPADVYLDAFSELLELAGATEVAAR